MDPNKSEKINKMKKISFDNIKGILFDMDGVVLDSEKLYSQSEKKLLSQYGVKFNDSDWLTIKGCTESQFYDLIYSKFNLTIPRAELINKGRSFLKELFYKKLNYMNGFENVHSKLKHKFKLALVTSTGIEMVNHINSFLSLYEKFDLIITSKDTKKHKPNPDPYLLAMKKLNLKPNQCIVIEDSMQGIEAGKKAGCFVVGLEGSLDKKFLHKADLIITNLCDLKNIKL